MNSKIWVDKKPTRVEISFTVYSYEFYYRIEPKQPIGVKSVVFLFPVFYYLIRKDDVNALDNYYYLGSYMCRFLASANRSWKAKIRKW